MQILNNMDREWSRDAAAAELKSALDALNRGNSSAVAEIQSLAENGSSLAMLYMGDTFANGRLVERDVDAGFAWYQRASRSGSIEASHRMAFILYHKREFDRCVMILETLSEKGYSPAMYCLGLIFHDGIGVQKDTALAIKCWKMAVSAGYLAAKRRLSIFLRSGACGPFGRLKGLAVLLTLVLPYVICVVTNPRSDRLRAW